MDKPRVTPKDFFLWAGAMIALYWSVIAFIFLFFNYVDYAFPNPLMYRGNPYDTGIPYEMASIIVVFPMYVALMWIIRTDISRNVARRDIWVRRWAIILTLFIAGLSGVIDVVTLLTAFFRGEDLTSAFLIKVALVLLVSAMVFMHFIADLWNYWDEFPERNRRIHYALAVLGVLSIAGGFFIVGTPQQARLHRLDEQKISDLQQIQSEVVTYWQSKQHLPATLSDLNDPISGFVVPRDPQTNATYEYRILGAARFELCATFSAPTPQYAQSSMPVPTRFVAPIPGSSQSAEDNTWYHGTGRTCFDRTIDPAFYPPTTKQVQ